MATAAKPLKDKDLSQYELIRVTIEDYVGLIQLYRPDKLNALNLPLMEELVDCLAWMDKSDTVRCIIITGDEKAFAAGADIAEMADASAIDMLIRDNLERWDRIRKINTPIIAAASGFVLGGGCELAMACDMMIASETTQFGQPEINIGVIPGAGGTQRLTRAIGKVKAMELVLTGRMMGAQEALEAGLINKVVPIELYLEEAKTLAKTIASKSPIAARIGKEAVMKAFDTPIEGGLDYERKAFYLLFASEDQKEGMSAFMEKRPADFKGR